EDVFLIPNAANTATVMALLADEAPTDLVVEDLHTSRAVLAVQGPRSVELLAAVGLPTELDYMSFATVGDVTVCRTGYTGELGFELLPRWDSAPALWDSLLAAGEPFGVRACGLGARDTLRTEMGYPLHGQDLSLSISPVQAKSGWAVGWDKPAFWGRDALVAEKAAGAARSLWGLESQDRGIPRSSMTVLKDGREIGEVTSGTFSPTRRLGIGLALLERGTSEGDEVTVDVRGRTSVMKVVKPPFVPSHVR
ncbi:MAG: glycine cleavage system protein, partial [Frankiales bacterium]|nr:glycine cleavage system protein [Frankiales bacterium]